MNEKEQILNRIRTLINQKAPEACVILYGSRARGDFKNNSDLDILILLKKDKITRDDEIKISYPLYDLEFETGLIISPLILSEKDWENRHRITPFYKNIKNDGVVL